MQWRSNRLFYYQQLYQIINVPKNYWHLKISAMLITLNSHLSLYKPLITPLNFELCIYPAYQSASVFNLVKNVCNVTRIILRDKSYLCHYLCAKNNVNPLLSLGVKEQTLSLFWFKSCQQTDTVQVLINILLVSVNLESELYFTISISDKRCT